MKNKLILLIIACLLMTCMTACKGENSSEELIDGNNKISNKKNVKTKGVACGEEFEYGDLNYNVIGVKTNEYSDGVKYLILKIEVYNNGSSDIKFHTIDRFELYGESGKEYTMDLFADIEVSLEGQITPDNKIMGEVAFEITDSKDESFTLHIGENYENYKPAITVLQSDINKTFNELFKSSGVTSKYGIGTTIKSDQFDITLISANVEPCDKDGKELLVCEFTIKNNKSDLQNFMMGFSLLGAYNSNGLKLDPRHVDVTLPVEINGNSSVTGKVPYYIETGTRDFYISVKPDLNEFDKIVNIVFSVQ
ncbi:DUF4352 domain-containing protein [Anaerovorax sp. IOR16]|uniref:DUF4352 domain-containing protein n=1 Tax=Anaerovorax sp. IOR16 TaxID=2773458 RepID=UPI0019D08EA0|nr:DUF4352 domain-containing protein [Anaerovorax sp. IOR16]